MKPREFWIEFGAHIKISGEYVRTDKEQVHVIEYGAYEELKKHNIEMHDEWFKKCNKIDEERDRYKSALEQIEKMPIFSTIRDFRDVATEALSGSRMKTDKETP